MQGLQELRPAPAPRHEGGVSNQPIAKQQAPERAGENRRTWMGRCVSEVSDLLDELDREFKREREIRRLHRASRRIVRASRACAKCGLEHSRYRDAAHTLLASYCHDCHAEESRAARRRARTQSVEQVPYGTRVEC